jgi:hypothetical protein
MDKQQNIDQYLEGWRIGDPALSFSATVDGFTYDDPNTGIIPRAGFVAFFNDFKQGAADLKGKPVTNPFLHYRDVVMDKNDSIWTVWCWWHAVGTDLQGCALIKVGDEGVLSEQISYYTRLPTA